jgi:hypothetical protein
MTDRTTLRRLVPSAHLSFAGRQPPTPMVRPVVVPSRMVGDARAARRRLVVAVDRTPRALDALRWAADEAGRRGLQVHIVGNRRNLARVSNRRRGVDRSPAAVRERARRVLDDIVCAALGDRSGLPLRVLISEAPLGLAASAVGRGADLIVVPVGGRWWTPGRRHRMLRCLRRASCPVVAVTASVPIAPTAGLRLLHGGRAASSGHASCAR